jgi:8-oxo-dGTP pyrophosphatase MutT (NUDIX family)
MIREWDAKQGSWLREARRDTFRAEYKPAPKWRSAGGIIMAGSERSMMHTIYMIKPSNNYNQGFYTFPKGKIDPGESKEVAACREIEEETGLRVRHTIDGYLGQGEGTMSVTDYFLMVAVGQDRYGPDFETEDVRPVNIHEAIRYLREHKRDRDLRIAELALERIDSLYAVETY